MSVTSVKPFENTHGGVDAEGVRTYTNVYHVYTDDKDDGSNTARFAAGVPAYGDTWIWFNDFDQYAVCKTRTAQLADVEGTRRKWIVTCGFTTALQRRDPTADQAAPDAEPWKISGSYNIGTQATSRDREKKAITNSAEEELVAEIPSGFDTLILEGITSTIDLAVRANAMLKCNSTPMWGLGTRRFMMMQWAYDIGYRAVTPYVRHRIEWHIKYDKWDLEVIDKGTRTIKDAGATDPELRYQQATAEDLQIVGGIYLDGSGKALDIKANPLGFPLRFEVIDEYDFLGNMGFLPNPLPGPFV